MLIAWEYDFNKWKERFIEYLEINGIKPSTAKDYGRRIEKILEEENITIQELFRDCDSWVEEYKKGMTINAIAKKYGRDNGTVEKYIANPTAVTKVNYKGRQIKNVNTGQIFKSINSAAKWAGCGATTLTRHLASDKIAGKVPETGEPAKWIEIL